MRRLALLGMAVALLAGCGSSGQASPTSPGAESLASTIVADVPSWVTNESLPADAIPGAKLFAVGGCTACHTYLGDGGSNLGAPDLTTIGDAHLGVRFEIQHLRCPACAVQGSPMPPFGSLGEKRLRQVAIFLEASKGRR